MQFRNMLYNKKAPNPIGIQGSNPGFSPRNFVVDKASRKWRQKSYRGTLISYFKDNAVNSKHFAEKQGVNLASRFFEY